MTDQYNFLRTICWQCCLFFLCLFLAPLLNTNWLYISTFFLVLLFCAINQYICFFINQKHNVFLTMTLKYSLESAVTIPQALFLPVAPKIGSSTQDLLWFHLSLVVIFVFLWRLFSRFWLALYWICKCLFVRMVISMTLILPIHGHGGVSFNFLVLLSYCFCLNIFLIFLLFILNSDHIFSSLFFSHSFPHLLFLPPFWSPPMGINKV